MATRTHRRVNGTLGHAKTAAKNAAHPAAPVEILEVEKVETLRGHRLRLTLSNGDVVTRNVSLLLYGPVFGPVRDIFGTARPFMGGVAWKNGADISPDVLIWGDRLRTQKPRRLLGLLPR